MKQTTNYNLVKPELTDSPPDITVMNPNWDKIDAKLKEFEEEKADLVDGKVPSNQLPSMNYLPPTGDGKDLTVTFTEAGTRANIATGEKLAVLLGKIKKYFIDLKTVAFTGSYTDLSNKPTSLPANGGDSDTVDGFHASAFNRVLNGTVNGTTVTFNNAITHGEYAVGGAIGGQNGAPSSGTLYGKLIVIISDGTTHNNSNNWIWQTFYSTSGVGHTFIRNKVNDSAWSEWTQINVPINHRSVSDMYGSATYDHFGHCRVINDLIHGTYTHGEALAATQGYILNQKIDNMFAYKYYGKYSQMSGGSKMIANGIIQFTKEDVDEFSAINISTSSSKIVIPNGITRVRFCFTGSVMFMGWKSGYCYHSGIQLYKNGSKLMDLIVPEFPTINNDTGFRIELSGAFYSPIIDCASGDYFELFAIVTNGTSVSIPIGSKFAMEVLK